MQTRTALVRHVAHELGVVGWRVEHEKAAPSRSHDFSTQNAEFRFGHVIQPIGDRSGDLRVHLLLGLPVLVEERAKFIEVFLPQGFHDAMANLLDALEAVHNGLVIHACLVERRVILQTQDA